MHEHTSALLALANPRDRYHELAVRVARAFVGAGGQWVGTTLVLAELHGHLLYRRGPELARSLLSRLLEDPAYSWLEVSAELVADAIAGWLARFRNERFSLADAVSFEAMRRERLDVAFAFDRHFETAGFALLP
ncbi:MAG TPA: PIN domain-containing protein [Gemmatimonadales bacterium]|nr:PIN domain-containing protein [Gemmatimonadales bacterium]